MTTTTRDRIMDAATVIVQAHGYNGLSFRVLAKLVGIKSASIHHHFPTKEDLGTAIVSRYREAAKTALQAIRDQSPDPSECLRFYAMGFRLALENGNRMCLCGLLGAEYHELPDTIKAEVQAFTEDNVMWLENVLTPPGDALAASQRNRAFAIYAAISGAQLTARSQANASAFDTIVDSYRATGLIPD